MKTKKLLLGTLGTFAAIAAPVATVVSCAPKGPTQSGPERVDLHDKIISLNSDKAKNAAFLMRFRGKYADANGTEFKQSDFAEITKSRLTIKKEIEAKKIKAYSRPIKATNTIVTLTGPSNTPVDVDLGAIYQNVTLTVKTAGSAGSNTILQINAGTPSAPIPGKTINLGSFVKTPTLTLTIKEPGSIAHPGKLIPSDAMGFPSNDKDAALLYLSDLFTDYRTKDGSVIDTSAILQATTVFDAAYIAKQIKPYKK